MRFRSTPIALAVVLGVSMLPGSTGTAAAPPNDDRAQENPARPGKVTFSIPLWTAQPGQHRGTVRVRYPGDQPPVWWDHQPVEIQVRHKGEKWTTVGSAKQKPVRGQAASRTPVTYTLPIHGAVQIRARAHSTRSSITSKARSFTVTSSTPAYDPTPLPRTRYNCWDPVIGVNPSQLAYGCPGSGEYAYNSWLYNARDNQRALLDTFTDYPEIATGADVAVGHALVFSGEDLDTYRARRYNLETGKSRWIAYRRNGKIAREAVDASISAQGRRIAYSSSSWDLSPKAPKGQNVYVVHKNQKFSRFLARGADTEIAAFGRYVVWRNPNSKIKRYDLRTGRKMSITKRRGHRRRSPDVSAGGRFVTYSEVRKGRRIVRVYDAKLHKRQTIAAGTAPVISDNGKFVAYLGQGHRELYLWNRETGDSSLVTVGPSGEGSGKRLAVPDISPNGRWIVAATRSAKIAPDNGRTSANNKIVHFDRAKD